MSEANIIILTVLWFNPHYNSTISTPIGELFLKLLDECIPPGHKLRKAFNRNTVKVSYSTTPNMHQIISAKNSKTLRKSEPEPRQCSCPKNRECPLENKCLTLELIYEATLDVENHETKTYIGQASTDFKSRLANHKQSFKNPDVNQTSLSQHVWDLKQRGLEPEITWKLVDRGRKYSPNNLIILFPKVHLQIS